MKKVLTTLAMALLLVGCAKEYDDSGIKARIDALETRVNDLETSIQGIQSAVGNGVFAQKVDKFVDPETGITTGITVTYTDGTVVYFTISPANPSEGPVLSVIRNGAGVLCWAVDGVILQINGKDVPVYETPEFSIDDEGNLIVEIDGEEVNLGPITSGGATLQDGIFTDLAVTDDAVILTLSDGSTVSIPFAEPFQLVIEKTEYVFEEVGAIKIPYTVSGATEKTVVGVTGYLPMFFAVNVTETDIEILPLSPAAQGHMLAYADSGTGLSSIVDIDIEPEMAIIADDSMGAYLVDPDGEALEIPVVSNVDIEAGVDEDCDWITIVETKSTMHTISVKVAGNTTGETRSTNIHVFKKGTEKIVQNIYFLQAPALIEPEDLSIYGTANSYIIYEAGAYKFAAVKGNSSESVGAVAEAEILWETANSETAPEVGSIITKPGIADGYIKFTATGEPGNALIAAKDAEGNILWSWHIWIPATDIETLDGTALCGTGIMDRNLGALVATSATEAPDPLSIGLFYQFGRKDPFAGIASFSSNTGAKVAGTAWTAHTNLESTEYAIAHPTEYIHIPSVDAGVWNADDPKDLWDNDSHEKTIYDPCPLGYKIPAYDKTLPMWSGSFDEDWTVDVDNHRFSYGDVVFPISGYLDCWTPSYSKVGERTHIWAANWYDAERGNCLYYRDGKYYSQKFHKAKAGSVRCVVDDSYEIVIPAVDLGEDGTANSYIVSEAGDYTFAAVKGNSEESVGTIGSVEVLWETFNNATAPDAGSIISAIDFADGYVSFTATGTPGNAVIAARDAADNILWSWHIWVPATAIQVENYGIYPAEMMDRNLGALVAATADATAPVESFGLTYQWGRKDPFVGPKAVNSSDNAAVSGTELSVKPGNGTTDDSCIASVEEAIANPTVLGFTQNGDWLPATAANNELWKNAEKTIYDPCPPGYRVPARDTESAFHSSDLSTATGWQEDATTLFWFALGDPLAVFPFAGYRDDYSPGKMTHAYDRAVYWTAYSSQNAKAYYVNVRVGSSHARAEAGKSRAGSVRCVAE